MDSRRARLIAEVVKHLESLDGEELGEMKPKAEPMVEGAPEEEAMETPDQEMAEAGKPNAEDELTDEEFEERLKL